MEKKDFQAQIEELRKASPLSVPSKLIELEFHDQETAFEIYDKISAQFEKEDLIDNIINPTICTVIDGILALPCFNGAGQKVGLSAQRVMNECKSFNYDWKCSFLMPDSQVESRNNAEDTKKWSDENRSEYDRSKYENIYEMNRYKKERIKANGGRVNMEDEYRMTRDISATRAGSDKRRNDPKFEHVAETDHIIPLHNIFEELKTNSGLSDEDIRRIANQDENFAVTGRMVNNPKRDMTNKEFIAEQERLKAEGKPYIELSDEVKANMIRMEEKAQSEIDGSVNDTILRNLSGRGHADRAEIKQAIEIKEKELGRKLNKEEAKHIMHEQAIKKTKEIYGNAAKSAAKQGLMYAFGNAILMIIKPLYYELKDGFMNGFAGGVNAKSVKEAFKIRFTRILDYFWSQLKEIKNYLGGFMDFIKNFISSLIESLLNMFVGIFKQLLRVVKEGIKIVMQSYSVLFGENAKNTTANEKGDAIIKIIGSSIVALCGIALDAVLKNLPETIRSAASTLLSGLAGILVFYALDKVDLFNAKAERRNKRIKEIFELRIQDIKDKTASASEAACEAARESGIKMTKFFEDISLAYEEKNYQSLTTSVSGLYQVLFDKPIETSPQGNRWNC